jgi:hypothetical protein
MSAATPTPRPASANFMTFGDLLERHHRSHSGTCRFCNAYGVEGMYYSTRAMVCVECAEKRRSEILPSVAKAEAKALRMASEHLRDTTREPWKPWMVRQISGVNLAFAEWACAQAGAK